MNCQNHPVQRRRILHFCPVESDRIIELISALSCLWSIWLNTRRNTLGWPVGLFSVLLAGWVYFQSRLFAECGLQVFYFVSGLYGWQQWAASEKSADDQAVAVGILSRREGAAGIFLALFLSACIFVVLQQFPRAGSPLPDALLTGFSLLAQFWLARRILENWLLWMAVNAGSVLLYLQRELWFFALLYLALLLLAFRGYAGWKKSISRA